MRSEDEAIEAYLSDIRIVGVFNCWRTSKKPSGGGYVLFWLEGKQSPMHCMVYKHLIGSIPRGLTLDHLCRHRWCCNPNHVEPVTRKVNILRGTCRAAVNARKTRCKRGHSLNRENTYLYRGTRSCRKCHRIKMVAWRGSKCAT